MANNCRHLNGSLDYLLYHGRGRSECVNKIEERDIVITTYNTLAKEHSAKLLGQGKSPLHDIKWYRVVLDEGQTTATFNEMVIIMILIHVQHTGSAVERQPFTKPSSSSLQNHAGAFQAPQSKTAWPIWHPS